MSVLVHAELVQLLAGNAVIAKTPSQGGAVVPDRRARADGAGPGCPPPCCPAAARSCPRCWSARPEIGAVAFVGGRSNGGKVAAALLDTDKRHFIEQEGLNAWGIWKFSQWDLLAAHLSKGFEYGKQRCTAYPRFVVQRDLVDEFLDMYLPVVASVRFGHPLAVDETDGDPLPELDFGPLISAAKADGAAPQGRRGGPRRRGAAVPGQAATGAPFLPGQDTSAYVAPVGAARPARRSAG